MREAIGFSQVVPQPPQPQTLPIRRSSACGRHARVNRLPRFARQQDIPAKYLEQLIRTLKKADLITSVRGAKGGHILARDPDAISLGAIVRLFEEQHELVRCISSPDVCHMADDCRVRLAWKEATDALYERLDAITIADLLCEPPTPTPDGKIKSRRAPAS